jgi:hypothetical protein
MDPSAMPSNLDGSRQTYVTTRVTIDVGCGPIASRFQVDGKARLVWRGRVACPQLQS